MVKVKPVRAWACYDKKGNLLAVYNGWSMPEIKELKFPKDSTEWMRVEVRPVRKRKAVK